MTANYHHVCRVLKPGGKDSVTARPIRRALIVLRSVNTLAVAAWLLPMYVQGSKAWRC